MTRIVDWAIQRTRLILATLFFLVLMGVISYINIPKEADPDIQFPFVLVQVPYPGISPEDAERLLVRPMEVRLRTIEGVKEITAIAQQNFATIGLEFDVSFDPDQALIDVREKVDEAKSELPSGTEEPLVLEFNASLSPVITIVLSGLAPERTMGQVARRLKDELEAIPSVLEADVIGQRDELLEIVIDPAKLESYNVTAAELFTAVTGNNRLVPAGALQGGQGRFQVSVPGLIETRADVLNLPIKTAGPTVVTLGDVADIRRTFVDAERFARFNGEPAIAIQVQKRLGENITDTIEAVRKVVEAERQKLPAGISLAYTNDQSVWIERSVNNLEQSVVLAIVLVMIVVLGALGWRSGLLVGLAIPSSFLIGFLALALGGFTMNFMVMFGLILAVGMLVDGAIIVTEYADREMAEGTPPAEAFAHAAKRMFWPIISSTATTLAAFFPMLVWPGVTGKFMEYLPLTLIFVLIAATIVALIFLPVLGSLIGRGRKVTVRQHQALVASETGDPRESGGLTGTYARLLSRIIRHPGKVLIGAVLTLVSVNVVFASFGRGVEFFVDLDPELAFVLVQARGNLSATEKMLLVTEVESRIRGVEGIKSVDMTTGGGGGGFGAGSAPDDTIGRISVEFLPYGQRPSGREIVEEIRQRTTDVPGVIVSLQELQGGPPTGKDVIIQLASNVNYPQLLETTRRISAYLSADPQLHEVDDTLPLPGIEWTLQVDRAQAGVFGADVAAVGNMVQLVTNGIKLGEYRPDDAIDEVDIRVRFPAEFRNLDELAALRVQTNQGLVPLSNFVDLVPAAQVNKITRVDGTRIMRVRANLKDEVKGDITTTDKIAELRTWIDQQDFPDDIRILFRGGQEQQEESGQFLSVAFIAALFMMGAILLAQFNSFWACFVVLLAVVFSTIGVMLGMLIMNQTFSVVMTGTGIVALAGIIVNNNIVLVDTFKEFMRGGMPWAEAIVRTGAQRLRPVFLTTVTTMIGLAPLMLQVGVNFFTREVSIGDPETEWWTQLATAVIFGMGFGTVLTLIVTPALLALPHRIRETGAGDGVFKWIAYVIGFPWYLVLRPLWRRITGYRGGPQAAE